MTGNQPTHVVVRDVIDVVAEALGLEPGELDATSSAGDFAEWTSLAHLRVAEAIEQRFDIVLTTAEVVGCNNIATFVEVIVARQN